MAAKEIDDELRELRREVIESRGLVIKTNNLTNALAADLKAIAKRQAGYERRISWNSATAYTIFVLLVLFGLKVLWDYRLENMAGRTEGSSRELESLRAKVDELEKREGGKISQEKRALSLYELMKLGKRPEFLEQMDLAAKEGLPKVELAFFQDVAERYRNELALERYAAGMDHVRLARWQEAATAFEDSLRIKPEATTGPSARLALAHCYWKLGKPRDAIPMYQALSETAGEKDVQGQAAWELAQVEQEIQAWNDAKATLRAFIKKFPDHARNIDARQQLAEMSYKH